MYKIIKLCPICYSVYDTRLMYGYGFVCGHNGSHMTHTLGITYNDLYKYQRMVPRVTIKYEE